MDGYPEGALVHNVPLLVASGLRPETDDEAGAVESKEDGVTLHSEIPSLEGKEAGVLRGFLEEVDDQGTSWTGPEKGSYRFRVKVIGRTFVLPSRRAALPDDVDEPASPPVLHSPLSPLSPVSALYPDGLINAQWILKHQERIPSVYACFYRFASDPSLAKTQDNALKADVNSLKAALGKLAYKSRLMLVLLGDEEYTRGSLPDTIQERLEQIRKDASLDPKSIFYIPPQESPADLQRVMGNILGVFYGTAVEYYRDLARHAKKKRSRGVVPQPTVPPTGTSHTLSLSDWNFRYDFKAGVFAEFRQEADAAMRSFDQAYEILLGSDVLDVIPSWSPRWNEARLLSDVICIRCLRIHFWLGQTSLAVRRWQAHRERIGDFVDRRGMGTKNYGWLAWEARWATAMANLIERVEVPGLALSTGALFLEPDKAVLGERLQPWELLHHTGYWYRLAGQHLIARRRLAQMIPEEDRRRPDSSTVSSATGKQYTYDTYLCPQPYEEYSLDGHGVSHAQLIFDTLHAARKEFQARGQLRIAAELALGCARELATLEKWDDALALLKPLWVDMSFRSEEWFEISEDLCWLLRRVAAETEHANLIVALDWELMNRRFTRRNHWTYDLSKSLEGISCPDKTTISLDDEQITSFISASFTFRNKESKAGETCSAQLALTSTAFPESAPVVLNAVRVDFEGSVKPIILTHRGETGDISKGLLQIQQIQLKEEFSADSESELPSELTGSCDLTLGPGQTRVFELTIPLREAGEATASSTLLTFQADKFVLDYRIMFRETGQAVGWYLKSHTRPRRPRSEARTLEVLPRPPKLDMRIVNCLEQYYANEPIELRLEIHNAEDESATAKLDIHLFASEVPAFRVIGDNQDQGTEGAAEEARVSEIALGTISSSSSSNLTVAIDPAPGPMSIDVHLHASYHLESDSTTPIMQTLTYQVVIVNAFEANYDLIPRLHPSSWPSVFDSDNVQSGDGSDAPGLEARGFAQKWCLVCHYASFAHDNLRVMGMEVKILSCVGGARCEVGEEVNVPADGILAAPKSMHEARFGLAVQKYSLDDRHPVSLDLAFIIKWKRGAGEGKHINTTTMRVGKYLVLGTEPRVLASVSHAQEAASNMMIQLGITIENPSGHFLTFGLEMEPSDEFAFSGAKQTTLHLLPLSRRTVTYRLVPLVRGRYVRPKLVVRDKYFQKVLRVIPTEGMKIDKDGLLVWVPGDTDGAEEGDSEKRADEVDGSDDGTATS